MNPFVELRRELHRHPELSGREEGTARRILRVFEPFRPDETLRDLGGHGLAFVFRGAGPGPTVMLRCELDALPISAAGGAGYRSVEPGVSHRCGHDGHMAVLAAVGSGLATRRPLRGAVVLLYQPAEETGAGAAAVLRDPGFDRIRPDLVFALHNLPGYPLGDVVLRDGVFSSASRGVGITLTGRAAHAAQPETGRSPATAMCRVIDALAETRPDSARPGEIAFVTVVGSRLGRKAFGTAPDRAEIWATLRCESDPMMDELVDRVEEIAAQAASDEGLDCAVDSEDIFPAAVNSARAVGIVERAAGDCSVQRLERPFRWSEDFGRFTAAFEGAIFGIGAGEDVPDLHDPDYDFPDRLIPVAADLYGRIIRECLDPEAGADPD